MSDDVKAAIERLDTYDRMRESAFTASPIIVIADWQILADKYRRQHRLDSVPLTEAVLRASGAVEQSYGWSWASGGPALFCDGDEGWRVSGVTRNARLKTAGDLQRLCDALHLGVTVVVPEDREQDA